MPVKDNAEDDVEGREMKTPNSASPPSNNKLNSASNVATAAGAIGADVEMMEKEMSPSSDLAKECPQRRQQVVRSAIQNEAVKCLTHDELLKASRRALQQHLLLQQNNQHPSVQMAILARNSDESQQRLSQKQDNSNDETKRSSTSTAARAGSSIREEAVELLKDDPELAKAVLYVANSTKMQRDNESRSCSTSQDAGEGDEQHPPEQQTIVQNAAKAIEETALLLQKSINVVYERKNVSAAVPSTCAFDMKLIPKNDFADGQCTDVVAKRQKEYEEEEDKKVSAAKHGDEGEKNDNKRKLAASLEDYVESRRKEQKQGDNAELRRGDSSSLASSEENAPSSLSSDRAFPPQQDVMMLHQDRNNHLSSMSSSSSENVARASNARPDENINNNNEGLDGDMPNIERFQIDSIDYRIQWELMLHQRPQPSDVHGTIRWLLGLFDIATLSAQHQAAMLAANSEPIRSSVSLSTDQNQNDNQDDIE